MKTDFIKHIKPRDIKLILMLIVGGAYTTNHNNKDAIQEEYASILKFLKITRSQFAILMLVAFDTCKLEMLYKEMQEPSEKKYNTKFQIKTLDIAFNNEWKDIREKYIELGIKNIEKKLKIEIN